MSEQLTTEQAIAFHAFHDSGAWKEMTPRQRAEFQMAQDKLCMPFFEFHAAVESALGRPVFTHEFGLNREGLQAELMGEKAAPTFSEVLGLIPAENRIVLEVAP